MILCIPICHALPVPEARAKFLKNVPASFGQLLRSFTVKENDQTGHIDINSTDPSVKIYFEVQFLEKLVFLKMYEYKCSAAEVQAADAIHADLTALVATTAPPG